MFFMLYGQTARRFRQKYNERSPKNYFNRVDVLRRGN